MSNPINIPIPQNPIGENFAWRDWFQKLSNKVYGSIASQNSNGVVITGGTIDGTAIGSQVPSTGVFTTLQINSPLAISSGGTNGFATPKAGAVAFGNGGAYAFTAVGTAGQVLTSQGTGAPIWSSASTGTVTSIVAGTGLSGGTITTTGTIAIANTAVTAGSYTNANITVNAQGQITSASNGTGGAGTVTSVSGTGSVNGITLSGTVTSSGSLTLGGTLSGISNSQLTNSSITVNGTNIALGASGSITAQTPNSLTIGSGLSGTSFNGSLAVTIALASAYGDTVNPYGSKTANYFLAAPNGSAGTPSFRAIVAADIPTLNQSTTGNAATATSLAGGSTYALPYQTNAGNTSYLSAGTSGSLLMTLGTTTPPVWVAPSSLTVGTASQVSNALTFGTHLTGSSYNGSAAVTIATDATNANTASTIVARDGSGNFSAGTITAALTGNASSATNLSAGSAYALPYQVSSGNTGYLSAGTSGSLLMTLGTVAAPTWVATSSLTVGTATQVSNALTIGTGLSGTSYNGSSATTIAISNTAVTAGSYTLASITVNAQGQITAASNGSVGSGTAPVTITAATYTVGTTDLWLIANYAGTVTLTLPSASSYSGRELNIQNYQAQTVVSASSNVVPQAGGTATTAILNASSGDACVLVSNGTNWVMTQYVPNNILLI
jgi:hypothetical protein